MAQAHTLVHSFNGNNPDPAKWQYLGKTRETNGPIEVYHAVGT